MLSQETSHLRSVNELLPEEQYTFRFQALLLTSSAISRVAIFAHTLGMAWNDYVQEDIAIIVRHLDTLGLSVLSHSDNT